VLISIIEMCVHFVMKIHLSDRMFLKSVVVNRCEKHSEMMEYATCNDFFS